MGHVAAGLSPRSTVDEDFSAWRDDGTWQEILDRLRGVDHEITALSEEPTPNAGSSDSQSVKATELGGERGYDGGKKLTGCKRQIAVDMLGLLLAVVVTDAAMDDAAAAPHVLSQLDRRDFPRLQVIWADGKSHNHQLQAWLQTHRRQLPWSLEIVRRPQDAIGFKLLPKRWVVERTFARLGRSRRLSKDDEQRTDSSECMVRMSAIHLLLNRLAPCDSQPAFNCRLAA